MSPCIANYGEDGSDKKMSNSVGIRACKKQFKKGLEWKKACTKESNTKKGSQKTALQKTMKNSLVVEYDVRQPDDLTGNTGMNIFWSMDIG